MKKQSNNEELESWIQRTKEGADFTRFEVLLIVIAFCIAFGIYLFPWIIPFIWDLPEGMTPAYYGILMALEMTPIIHKWKKATRDFENE